MLWLYRLLYLPALVLGAPYYLWRMRRRGGYRGSFGQRMGRVVDLPPKTPGRPRIWLQAVSVGEMLAIGPMLEAWHREQAVEIYLTTTTSTGYRLARERYGGMVAGLGYFPLDWWPFSRRAWRQVQPDLVILTEGERWPEHIHQARVRGVPVVCVNARLSDRSYRRMQRVRWAVAPLLAGVTRVLACSAHDAERFRALGIPADRIEATGNIKLDVAIPRLDAAGKARLRSQLGLPPAGLVLMGASTWAGEETALIEAFRAARAQGVDCTLLLVPRHAERRGEIEELLQASGHSFHLRSRGAAAGTVEVAVGDTTGELRQFLQLADLVFIGKSLPPHTEGQTPVEAAALGRAMVFGTGMGNFRAIARELQEQGGVVTVADAAALVPGVVALLREPDRRATLGAAAQAWHRANVGAVERTLAEVRRVLGG
ncbi:MAG: 3-deoxy-D-manno-octulosonic acid transferase [Opitutaceae bacterium]|nr:3-deoxy-D-manno-octulosonic acid transferase [Opitutaceae bacterium]